MATSLIRSSTRHADAEEWVLVLASAGLSSRSVLLEDAWWLEILDEDTDRVVRVLAEWEVDKAKSAPAVEPVPSRPADPWLGTVVALIIALVFVASYRDPEPLLARAANTTVGVAHGQLWRVVTALFLHADVAHVLGNAAACWMFLPALTEVAGVGFAALVTLAAGALGNFSSALMYSQMHRSIGSSTAMFGALGAVTVLRATSAHRGGRSARSPWLVLIAGVVLLAMLGAGENADVWAHAFGAIMGALLGGALALGHVEHARPSSQWIAGAVTIAIVLVSWAAAWSGSFHAW